MCMVQGVQNWVLILDFQTPSLELESLHRSVISSSTEEANADLVWRVQRVDVCGSFSLISEHLSPFWAPALSLHPLLSSGLVSGTALLWRLLLMRSLFCSGYFLQDFVDMLCNQKLHQSWELLFHHSVVIICFSIAVLVHRYIGFTLVALLVEINSIFLHLRQILLMANLLHTTCYRLNSILNLGTYVVFRISTLAWMTRWLVLNRENIPLATYTVGTVGMAIMTPMNIILFYRLLRSDFLKFSREARQEKEK
ncbi:TLC domain-containing protein 2 isoform X2 [Emydura macquarii macquarii]|uniref:TLC domain-containing protein 2 isoform X2 n=1 Tax=Emydura macquarii macquarii TaxID=1129001 RepID=UPI00352A3D1D